MKTPQDGGPAFPLPDFEWQEHKKQNNGMTLRDYFAAAALQGMLADKSKGYPYHEYAADAYSFAEAMLAERAKTKEEQP